jgi:nucleoside-diphosphate-sugar epimerase
MTDKPVFLITGTSGFIGQQVVAALPGDANIHGVSQADHADAITGIQWHRADLRDPQAAQAIVNAIRPSHLIHLAWTTAHGKFWSDPENQSWLGAGTALVRSFAEAGGRRAVIAGTCAEYPASAQAPLREDQGSKSPGSAYGAAKDALRRAVQLLADEHSFSLAWPRIFSPYGPGEAATRLIPSIILSVLNNRPARCASGRQKRDFMDVRDLGAAIAALAQSDYTGIINLGSGEAATIADVARMIGEKTGRPDLIELGALADRPGESETLVPDLRRMKNDLHFTPKISLASGIDNSIANWRAVNDRRPGI